MNILFFPELFFQISTNLNDKEKRFLISCSKNTYNLKLLIKLDSEYNLEKIPDNWRMCVKNIIISKMKTDNDNYRMCKNIIIKELIENSISESFVANSKYIKFVSNNTNIKLFHNVNLRSIIDSCSK